MNLGCWKSLFGNLLLFYPFPDPVWCYKPKGHSASQIHRVKPSNSARSFKSSNETIVSFFQVFIHSSDTDGRALLGRFQTKTQDLQSDDQEVKVQVYINQFFFLRMP